MPLLFLLGAGFALMFPSSAAASTHMQQCGPHDPIVAGLERKWGELLVLSGIDKTGALLEIFVSPGGTFSVLATRPGSQIACVLDFGKQMTVTRAACADPKPEGEGI